MKHQPWVRLPKPSKYDPDFLEARGYGSFHGSLRYATVHCWALKRHLEDLVNVDTSKSSSSTKRKIRRSEYPIQVYRLKRLLISTTEDEKIL